MSDHNYKKVIIIGAGPAGLTCAYRLAEEMNDILVLEASSQVGGLSKTISHQGFRADIGGHRFITKSKRILDIWQKLLGEGLLIRPRKSYIRLENKVFNYPVDIGDVLSKVSIIEILKIIFSYLKSKLFPVKPEVSYEDWMINRFGKKLFDMFFREYTEKVWGLKVSKISKDWAVQRVKSLSLFEVIKSAFWKGGRKMHKTLSEEFYYPKFGPGMLWEKMLDVLTTKGVEIQLNSKVVKIQRKGNRYIVHCDSKIYECEYLVSTMPLRLLINSLQMNDKGIIKNSNELEYRDFITVLLCFKKISDENATWMYIHDKNIRSARVQFYHNWSEFMVPKGHKSVGMEYFVFRESELYHKTDKELLKLALKEAISLGFAKQEDYITGKVIRAPFAYPVYSQGYQSKVRFIHEYLHTQYKKLYTIGRAGMHRWNNQDHSMMTGIIVAEKILRKTDKDEWSVNNDAEFIESERLVPDEVK